MKETYFNTNEEFGRHSLRTLRVIDGGDGFAIMKGGIVDQKGKLKQAEVVLTCETKEEAERVIGILCSIEKV